MTTHKVSWNQFKTTVSNITEAAPGAIYRGQSDASWGLVSSYHRLAASVDSSVYWGLLDELKDYVETWSDHHWDLSNNQDISAFVGFLQHNGFPTPLLDWTDSPYIAAYFAFDGVDDAEPQNDDVSIFAFDTTKWVDDWQQVMDLKSATPHVSVLRSPARGNRKQIIQQGVYTFTNVQDQQAHIEHIEEVAKKTPAPTYLYKYEIPSTDKPAALRDLHTMAINAMTLFPNIEGVCKYLRSRYFSPPSVGMTPSQRTEAFLESLKSHSDAQAQTETDSPPDL